MPDKPKPKPKPPPVRIIKENRDKPEKKVRK